MKPTTPTAQKMKRTHYKAFVMNDLELEAFNKYCKKYKIKNQAKFMREAIVGHILRQFDKDYPSLFEDQA